MAKVDELMNVFMTHGFGGQHWSSTDGYTVRCLCEKEFHIGLIENKVSEPAKSQRLIELTNKIENLGTIIASEAEEKEYKTLYKAHSDAHYEVRQKNATHEREVRHAPILQHVREEFEKVVNGKTNEDEELSVDCSKCGSKAGSRCKSQANGGGYTDRVHNARRLALDEKKKKITEVVS